jgi:hypothetical protein
MCVLSKYPCLSGDCPSCAVLRRPDESRQTWYARLRARIADAPRTCEGIEAHPWTPENVQTRPDRTSYCRACANARRRKTGATQR